MKSSIQHSVTFTFYSIRVDEQHLVERSETGACVYIYIHLCVCHIDLSLSFGDFMHIASHPHDIVRYFCSFSLHRSVSHMHDTPLAMSNIQHHNMLMAVALYHPTFGRVLKHSRFLFKSSASEINIDQTIKCSSYPRVVQSLEFITKKKNIFLLNILYFF